MFTERYYQRDARLAIFDAWKEDRSTLAVMPTGTGKTVLFAGVCRDIVQQGGQPVVIAHRGELLTQASDKILRSVGLSCGLEKAESTAHDTMDPITVASVQTLKSPKRLERYDRNHFTHIIIDEAHHALSESYQAPCRYFANAKILGVTATADRGDKRSLGTFFDSLAYEYLIGQAIADGFLAKLKALTVPLTIDIQKADTRDGDFIPSDLDAAITPYLEQIAAKMVEHCQGRKVLVFLPLIATSKKFAEILCRKGFKAGWVSGDDPDRDKKLIDFEANIYNVLCNSMLLTEGYDCPDIDCVISLRPTKIRSLYAQMIGRGTRIHPGKDHLLILDFLWNIDKHDLCKATDLTIDDEDVAAAAQAIITSNAGYAVDIDAALTTKAESDAIHIREKALAKTLDEMRKKKAQLVDPIQYAVSVGSNDLLSYQPAFGHDLMPVTPAQAKALEKAGINPDAVQSQGMAGKILGDLAKRKDAGMASPKMVRALERYGFQHVGEMTHKQSKTLLNRIAANGWRIPHDIDPRNHR